MISAKLFNPFALGNDRFPEFARRRATGGAAWGEAPYPEVGQAYYVFSHALVSKALKHPSLLQAPPGAYQATRQKITANYALDLLTKSMMLSDPPQHLQLRRPLAGSLTPSLSARLFDSLLSTALHLTQKATEKPDFDAVRDLAVPLSFSTLENILGIDIDNPWSMGEDAQCMAKALEMRPEGVDPDANDACRRLELWVSSAIDKGAIRPNGMAAQMLAEVEAGRWHRDDAVANIVFLLFAGQATVVDTFGNALVALECFPDQRKLLEDGRVSWLSAAEELLRYCAPVHYAGARIAANDFDFDGVAIRAGQAVVPVLASANRDAAVFPAGDQLDLNAAVSATLTFGTGLHVCLGQHVARLELAALLEALFTKAGGWRLDLPRVVRRPSVLLYGLQTAPLVLPFA
ncbi:MAG: cytochrome P450 [Mesorhizobium sp.]|uniref:cytochrome P450 n=1 Tax=Mesorhizobium sp. TaxID=1871066 RepID=UPI000FE80524|nr:cytochrome P450 [Mesorhizobium sp.]RWN65417.1 MAG: cytochrome P450 [Mesorhizobium sp.]RWP70496.1 MAG: cytochrome P450 [Mesorhizobium sp.]